MSSRSRKMQIFNKKVENVDFSHINSLRLVKSSYLNKANFEATNLENLKVKHSTLRNANLKKCILVRSRFSFSNLEQTDMEYANLSQNSFYRANLKKTNLQCTSFKNSTISESALQNADLRWANLEGAVFIKSDLSKANFCNTNMQNVKIVKCRLQGAKYNIHTLLPFNKDKAEELGMIYVS